MIAADSEMDRVSSHVPGDEEAPSTSPGAVKKCATVVVTNARGRARKCLEGIRMLSDVRVPNLGDREAGLCTRMDYESFSSHFRQALYSIVRTSSWSTSLVYVSGLTRLRQWNAETATRSAYEAVGQQRSASGKLVRCTCGAYPSRP